MIARAFYNEHDPHAAAWLRRLIRAGKIPTGVVDSRSILSVRPSDLDGFTSFHAFAGIGGWALALRLAGWPDDRPVWTGSPPCQPFSSAGRREGLKDERHLWPAFFRLIEECRPQSLYCEQVSSADGLEWLDVVSADLEGAGYAVGALDLCAASVGAPHRRQRLYVVGHADSGAAREHADVVPGDEGEHGERSEDGGHGAKPASRVSGLADAEGKRGERREAAAESHGRDGVEECGEVERLANADANGCEQQRATQLHDQGAPGDDVARRGPLRPWADLDWVLCDDPGGPRWRPVEPGTEPLADGVPEFVGRLRGYGNAIVPQLAAEFIAASMELAT